ncbi:MAG TPA: hypothetical protein VGO03_03000 [Acidimicrobiia bacterium]|jgi:hypothetical protein
MATTLRFGKQPKLSDYRTLRFKDYLTDQLAAPPATFDVLANALSKLSKTDADVPTLFPMDGNDQYGDCTIAAVAHAITIYEGLVGKAHVMPAKSVEKTYFHLSGGGDTGLNELNVLNYWQSHMVGREKILAYTKVDPKDHNHVKQAMGLFGGVYLGFQCQENCIDDFNNHVTWTPGTLTNDGHAVYAVAYDADTVTVLTWGSTQKGTWAWWDECVDEAYAILPPDAEKPGFAPGYNFQQLKQDLDGVAN